MTEEREKALKLRDSSDLLLHSFAISFEDGVSEYCQTYLDQSPEFHGILAKDDETMRSELLTPPANREEEIARLRQSEVHQKWFLAYQRCNASVMAGTLHMPSKLDLEMRADKAEKDIAEIDRKLTNPEPKPPRWLPLP